MKTIVLFSLLLIANFAFAQTSPVTLPSTEIVSIRSSVMKGETYQLLVHVPKNYQKAKKYEVVYVLDGINAFPIAIDCLGILYGECGNTYVEPILVGISDGTQIGDTNNKRDRDFTPTKFSTPWGMKGGGGGPAFLSMIEKEIIPYVNAHYATNGKNTLYGYSFGGLFSSYVLLTKPELFHTILIGSPSLFADEKVIIHKLEPSFAVNHKDLPNRVWLSVGENDTYLKDDAIEFSKILQKRAYPNLKFQFTELKGLNHLTGIHPTMLQAFKWAFCQ